MSYVRKALGLNDHVLLGHEEYTARFDVDRETQMYGSVKPYRRQVRMRRTRSLILGCMSRSEMSFDYL